MVSHTVFVHMDIFFFLKKCYLCMYKTAIITTIMTHDKGNLHMVHSLEHVVILIQMDIKKLYLHYFSLGILL